MPCEEVKAAKYQTRKSPPFHAGDCKGLTKKGKDGDYVSKPDAKGIYKWVKGGTRKAKGKSYDIHDNGGRPFRVEISGKTVEIYKGKPIGDTDEYEYTELIKKLTVQDIHIGESKCASTSYISDGCGAWTRGNTILLHLSGNKYMFVGQEIYEFTMEDEFEAYYSNIGHNDVPYPVVIGSKYVYLMLDSDHKYIPRELFKAPMNASEWADAYAYFYGFKDLETGETVDCFTKFKTKLQERKKCEKQHSAKHAKMMKGADTKMMGFRMICKRA